MWFSGSFATYTFEQRPETFENWRGAAIQIENMKNFLAYDMSNW